MELLDDGDRVESGRGLRMSLYKNHSSNSGSNRSQPLSLTKLNEPKQDDWYIRQIIKRLKWPKCEEREAFIQIFKNLFPRLDHRANELYDKALSQIEMTKPMAPHDGRL